MNKLCLALWVVVILGTHNLLAQDTLNSSTLKQLPLQEVNSYVPDTLEMKIKTRRYAQNITYVKAMVKQDTYTAEQAKRRGVKQLYLAKLIFQEENETVLMLKGTPYLSNNPLVRFVYKSDGGKKLSLTAYNNVGKHAEQSVVIKDDPRTKKFSLSATPAENAITTSINDKAIYAYFGDVKLIPSDKIQLVGPELASNGGAVPIAVRFRIEAKTVTLFAMEEKGTTKMIAQWILYKQTLVDFQIKIKLDSYSFYGESTVENYDGSIYPANAVSVVVEGLDGKYYIATIAVEVAIAGGN